jgi:hypothetical protein
MNGLVMVAETVQITASRGGIIRKQQTANDWLRVLPRFLFGAKEENHRKQRKANLTLEPRRFTTLNENTNHYIETFFKNHIS